MKNLFTVANAQRIEFGGFLGDSSAGAFMLRSSADRQVLRIIAATHMGWDHVSVSRGDRIPNWTEMEQVKHEFFKDDETAMQLHVPAVDHINCHPHCLHLWRPLESEIPRPPAILVGPPR